MTKLNFIEGIGSVAASRLQSAGIDSLEQLLDVGRTPESRRELASETGISSKRILRWIKRAELARIKGVGEEYVDLLDAAGIGDICALAMGDASQVHKQLVRVNSMKKLVRRVPAVSRVSSWVEQAKQLDPAVDY